MSSLSPRRGLAAFALAAATIAVLCAASGAVSAPLSDAPDGPGALSHFDLARKDCVGTARNTDVEGLVHGRGRRAQRRLLPDVDNTNVETLQYVVTDGSTFTDLQTRDMTYTVAAARRRRDGLRGDEHARRAASTGSSPTTSPTRAANAVLMQVRVRASRGRVGELRLYVRFDPTVNGNGGGGSGQRRRRLGDRRHVDRAPDAGRLRHRHRDQRGQPRLRAAGLRRARRRPVRAGHERLRRARRATG